MQNDGLGINHNSVLAPRLFLSKKTYKSFLTVPQRPLRQLPGPSLPFVISRSSRFPSPSNLFLNISPPPFPPDRFIPTWITSTPSFYPEMDYFDTSMIIWH